MESKNFTAAVFCSRLKSARIKAKLSQTELANRIGRPAKGVLPVMGSSRRVSWRTFGARGQFFGVYLAMISCAPATNAAIWSEVKVSSMDTK